MIHDVKIKFDPSKLKLSILDCVLGSLRSGDGTWMTQIFLTLSSLDSKLEQTKETGEISREETDCKTSVINVVKKMADTIDGCIPGPGQ